MSSLQQYEYVVHTHDFASSSAVESRKGAVSFAAFADVAIDRLPGAAERLDVDRGQMKATGGEAGWWNATSFLSHPAMSHQTLNNAIRFSDIVRSQHFVAPFKSNQEIRK
jgi:hypothetical protein